MKRQDFYFDLPDELIAQYPLPKRRDSRLLTYHIKTGAYAHHQFSSLAEFLMPGDLLVMNDSKVLPARLFGCKTTGGKVELLVERITGEFTFLAHLKASKTPHPSSLIHLEQDKQIKMLERKDDLFLFQADIPVLALLNEIGHIPLPLYIHRQDEPSDKLRYQTIYAKSPGSVAAPTAGLHFDEIVLASLAEKKINTSFLTLHVGAGTFRPVRSDNILEHKMHAEFYSINQELCDSIIATKKAGKRVIAVGTTTLRSLESAAQKGKLQAASAYTDIFIYPGFKFKLCDGLLTNFHLPESTLLMLVSAFIGHQQAMDLYKEAVEKKYRFFSYGDASLLL